MKGPSSNLLAEKIQLKPSDLTPCPLYLDLDGGGPLIDGKTVVRGQRGLDTDVRHQCAPVRLPRLGGSHACETTPGSLGAWYETRRELRFAICRRCTNQIPQRRGPGVGPAPPDFEEARGRASLGQQTPNSWTCVARCMPIGPFNRLGDTMGCPFEAAGPLVLARCAV